MNDMPNRCTKCGVGTEEYGPLRQMLWNRRGSQRVTADTLRKCIAEAMDQDS